MKKKKNNSNSRKKDYSKNEGVLYTNLGLNNSSYPTRTEFNNYYLFVFANLFLEKVICILNFGISSISQEMCFQYSMTMS